MAPIYFPSFGSVRTVKFTCDVYTNDSSHRLALTVNYAKI